MILALSLPQGSISKSEPDEGTRQERALFPQHLDLMSMAVADAVENAVEMQWWMQWKNAVEARQIRH